MKTLLSTIIIKNSKHYLSSISCLKTFLCVLLQLILKRSLSGYWGIYFHDPHFLQVTTEAGRGMDIPGGGKQS